MMELPVRILLADDDESIRALVRLLLQNAGFEVVCVKDGFQALELWRCEHFDLIILDVMMPIQDGLETCRIIRKASDVPVILLSVRRDEEDIVQGFEAGAYDYVVKPFGAKELVARIRATLLYCARLPASPISRLVYGDLELDPKARQVLRAGKAIHLSPTEFRLLLFFMQHVGELVSKEELLQNIWGFRDVSGDLNLVETAVRRLRKKIEIDPKRPHYIQTKWGAGYRFGSQKHR